MEDEMAYFSNGSEGEVLDQCCLACIHGMDDDGNSRQGQPCAVWLLQTLWNYEQHETDPDAGDGRALQNGISMGFGLRSREARVKKMALDTLLPQTDRVLCAMFLPARPSDGG